MYYSIGLSISYVILARGWYVVTKIVIFGNSRGMIWLISGGGRKCAESGWCHLWKTLGFFDYGIEHLVRESYIDRVSLSLALKLQHTYSC